MKKVMQMSKWKKPPATGARLARSGWENDHMYYTTDHTEAQVNDYEFDNYAIPRRIKKITQENTERTWMDYEL